MEKEFVERTEFNQLKEDVDEIKRENAESKALLHEIDKKLDIITTKVVDADKYEELKLSALEEEVKELKDNQKWLRRTIIGAVLGIVGEAIVFVIQLMK